ADAQHVLDVARSALAPQGEARSRAELDAQVRALLRSAELDALEPAGPAVLGRCRNGVAPGLEAAELEASIGTERAEREERGAHAAAGDVGALWRTGGGVDDEPRELPAAREHDHDLGAIGLGAHGLGRDEDAVRQRAYEVHARSYWTEREGSVGLDIAGDVAAQLPMLRADEGPADWPSGCIDDAAAQVEAAVEVKDELALGL